MASAERALPSSLNWCGAGRRGPPAIMLHGLAYFIVSGGGQGNVQAFVCRLGSGTGGLPALVAKTGRV
jgi:hypothetical protein